MQNIGRALDKTRCRIMKKYAQENGIEYYLLKNYHDLLRIAPNCNEEKVYNHRLKRYVNRYDLKRLLLDIDDELLVAANFYTTYQRFNSGRNLKDLSNRFDQIVGYKAIIKIPEFVPIINMLETWEEYILNSFTYIEDRRVSNGPLEGLNSQLKKLMRIANGWQNFARFRVRLMHCYNNEISIKEIKNKIPKILRKKRGKYNKNRQRIDGFDPSKV